MVLVQLLLFDSGRFCMILEDVFCKRNLEYDKGFFTYVIFTFQFLTVKTVLSNFMSESEGYTSQLGL